jgi:2-methylisocitrate lyase-like PEP mutase family enzyme
MSFKDLHQGAVPLVLPNAWDLPSALMFLDAGFTAIGTISLGLAASHGHTDGSRAVRELAQKLTQELSTLQCFVSVDIEDGFADVADDVARYVEGLAADGINIEDSTNGQLVAPAMHAAKVAAIKAHTPNVFVNARVDNFWLGEEPMITAVVARARRYVDAGADGIFVPGTLAPAQISALTEAVPVPVNVLATPEYTLEQLTALGVRRISTGSLPYRAALDAAVRVATDVRGGRAAETETTYARVQEMVRRYNSHEAN